jgi:hypothetical protein
MEVMRNSFEILVGKPDGNHFGNRDKWKDHIKWILNKYGSRIWIGLILPKIGPSNRLSNCQVVNKNPVP